jgi:hypothetical protein
MAGFLAGRIPPDTFAEEVDGTTKQNRLYRIKGDTAKKMKGDLTTLTGIQVNGLPSLDIVAHSPNGVIEIGQWRLTRNDYYLQKQVDFVHDHFSCIRLLGCNTAQEGEAADALVYLEDVFCRPVLGTTCAIHQDNHFDGDGFQDTKVTTTLTNPAQVDDALLLSSSEASNPAFAAQLKVGVAQARWFAGHTEVPFTPDATFPLVLGFAPAAVRAVPFANVPFFTTTARIVPRAVWKAEFGFYAQADDGTLVRVSIVAGGSLARLPTPGGPLFWNLSDDHRRWVKEQRLPIVDGLRRRLR